MCAISCSFCRSFIGCIIVFVLGITAATQGQQQDANNAAQPKEINKQLENDDTATQNQEQDTNDVALLKEKIKQLSSKVRIQEDIIRRAATRISALETQLKKITEKQYSSHSANDSNGVGPATPPEENYGSTGPKPVKQADESQNALRIERLNKKINDANNAIALDWRNIENLPSIWLLDRYSKQSWIPDPNEDLAHFVTNTLHLKAAYLSYGDPDYARRTAESQDSLRKLQRLLFDINSKYKEMLLYTERYSDLGVNSADVKKWIAENDRKIRLAESLLNMRPENRGQFNLAD